MRVEWDRKEHQTKVHMRLKRDSPQANGAVQKNWNARLTWKNQAKVKERSLKREQNRTGEIILR